MKLSQYDANVSRNVEQAHITPAGTLQAYGSDTRGLQGFAAAIGQVGDIYRKKWLSDQNNKVIDAANDYNQQINSLMDDENKGLYNTMQGKNAEGLQDAYSQEEKKIYQNVLEKYHLDTNYAMRAFDQQRQGSMESTLHAIDRYQRQQKEVYAGDQLSGLSNTFKNNTLRNPNALITNYETYNRSARAIMADLGMDQATIDTKVLAMQNQDASEILKTFATTNDYSAGQSAIAFYRTRGIDETTLKPYADLFAQKKLAHTTKESFEAWAQRNGINFTKMSKDDAWKLYQKDHPLNAGQFTVKGFATGNQTYDQWDDYFSEAQSQYGLTDAQIRNLKAMCMRESSFNPYAQNGDHIGPFQFSSSTAQEMGLDPADRTDPEKSILAAAKYYKYNLDAHGGDDDSAILSHNGGTNGVEAARAEGYLDDVRKDYNLLYPGGNSDVGSKITSYAENNYTLGDQWMGTVTKDANKQCDSWTADVYSKTGLIPGNTLTRASDFEGCYHTEEEVENGGYNPQPGDFIDGKTHVGIYLGDGKYMARNSQGGIHIGDMDEFNDISGGVIGYGSVNQLAEKKGIDVSGDYMSDEEKEQLTEKQQEVFDSEYENAKRNQVQYISNQIQSIQQRTMEMQQGGSSAADVYSYVSDMVSTDPLLKDSSQGASLLHTWFNAKESEARRVNAAANSARGLSSDGTLKSKNFNALDSLIGDEINSEDELADKLNVLAENGIYVSPEQKAQLEKDLTDAQNGVGPHSVKIPDDDEAIANACYTSKSAVTPTAKMLIKREILSFKNEQGRDPDADELRTIYFDVIGKQKLDDTYQNQSWWYKLFHSDNAPQMSEAEMYDKHISDLSQAVDEDGEPNGYYLERDYGNGKKDTIYVSNEQMQSIADGSLNVFDI